jgi:hypothetical protein
MLFKGFVKSHETIRIGGVVKVQAMVVMAHIQIEEGAWHPDSFLRLSRFGG